MEALKLQLIRYNLQPEYTEGSLIYVNKNRELCDTLEDKVRDANADGTFDGDESKVYGETAIPYGTYPIKVTYSPKFKRKMVLIMDVKHFTGIRMHWGRTAKNSEGCPLVGAKVKDGELGNIGMTDYLVDLLESHGNEGTITIV